MQTSLHFEPPQRPLAAQPKQGWVGRFCARGLHRWPLNLPLCVVLLGVAGLYFFAGRLGLSAAPGKGVATPVWPAGGLALGLLLVLGWRVWPGIWLGALALGFVIAGRCGLQGLAFWGAALGLAAGSLAGALAGAWLTVRFARGRHAFCHPRSSLMFVALAAVLSGALSVSCGLLSLSLAGAEGWANFGKLWLSWWLGHLVGGPVITPLIVVWGTRRMPLLTARRWAELAGLLLLLAGAGELIFGGWLPRAIQGAPLAVLATPALVWAALRFGQRGTTGVIALLAAVALLETAQGHQFFAVSSRQTALLMVDNFIAVSAVMALVLAADVAQRRKSDHDLEHSEQRYRALFETNPLPMWVFDCQTLRFLAVNQAAVEHYGYRREEFLAMTIGELRPAQEGSCGPAGPASPAPLSQCRHRRKDGSLIEVELIRRSLNFGGQRAGLVLSMDITERKQAEKRAGVFSELGQRLSEASTPREAAQIIAAAAESLFGWDASVLDLGPTETQQMETVFCMDTIEGQRVEMSCPAQQVSPIFMRVFREGAQLLLRGQPAFGSDFRPFGDERRASASLMFVPLRSDQAVFGVFSIQSYKPQAYSPEDLQVFQALADHCGGALERIRSAAHSRQSAERLHLALMAGKMGTWTVELLANQRLKLSAELESIFGFGPGELDLDLPAFIERVEPRDRPALQQALARGLESESEQEVEMRLVPQGRPARWLLARGRAERDEQGQAVRLVGVAVDITQLKTAEEEVLRLNSELEQRVRERTAQLEAINKELEAFSYSVSHDLRAPLRSVRGFSEVLLERYSSQLDARGQEFLRRACESSQHMDRLIEDLLKLSRVSRSELQLHTVELSGLAQAIVDELRQAEPLRAVECVIAPGLRARGDERLLRVVMDNLLRNAWKFTAKTAAARIEFGALSQPEGAFFVRDNGAGFDMAYASRLFGVFQRLHSAGEFPGTGVGLATVQRILNRHGGQVWAQAAVGQGATFFFSLPA